MYSCHLFLISSASVRSIPFLSFIEPIFAWTVPLVSLIFLKRSLDFPILLFSSISLHWSLRKAFLSLLAILWNSAFRCLYLSFPPLLFNSLLFSSQLFVRPPQTAVFLFCISFPLGWSWSLSPVQCHEPPSIVHQALYLLYNHKGFRSYLNGLVVFPTVFNLSLSLAIRSSWSEPQSSPGLVFVNCIELLHLCLQRI